METKKDIQYIIDYITKLKPCNRNNKIISTLPTLEKLLIDISTPSGDKELLVNEPKKDYSIIKEVTFNRQYTSEQIRAYNGMKREVLNIMDSSRMVKIKEGWFNFRYFYELED